VEDRLVYDVGVNDGRDSAYYLHKGYRVVGIEAHPLLAEQLRRRFAAEIAEGSYTLLDVGIAEQEGEAEFWICDSISEWSSFHREIAARQGSPHHSVSVRTRPFSDILTEYGVPYYCKVDIEGNDRLCLAALSVDRKPQYLSIEMSHSQGGEDLELLKDLGYTRFKLVSQRSWAQPIGVLLYATSRLPQKMRRYVLSAERRLKGVPSDGSWHFQTGSSGPFAEQTPGPWRGFSHVYEVWQRLHDLTDGRSTLGNWFDIHATS
jgi:FkbM family methyltransferase